MNIWEFIVNKTVFNSLSEYIVLMKGCIVYMILYCSKSNVRIIKNNFLFACVKQSTNSAPGPFIRTYCLINLIVLCSVCSTFLQANKPSRRTYFPFIRGLQKAETIAISRDGNHDHIPTETRAVQLPPCPTNLPKLNVQAQYEYI